VPNDNVQPFSQFVNLWSGLSRRIFFRDFAMSNETGTEEMKPNATGMALSEHTTDTVLLSSRFTKKEKWFIVCVASFVGLFRQAFVLPAIGI
jgi:hypothetical protein